MEWIENPWLSRFQEKLALFIVRGKTSYSGTFTNDLLVGENTNKGKEINVHITSSVTLEEKQRGGQTVANYSERVDKIYTLLPFAGEGQYTTGAITIRLDFGVSDADVVLAHEAGHTFSLTADPKRYFSEFEKGVDCQSPKNRNLYQVKDAIRVQCNYLRLRREKRRKR